MLYLGGSFLVCFVEAVLRDQRDGVHTTLFLDEADIRSRVYATIAVAAPLRLVDLRSNGTLRMGVPRDVLGARNQTLAQQWSVAIHDHPERPDGIIYPSRLNGETNLAIYDRAVDRLSALSVNPLECHPDLPDTLELLQVAIMPA